MTNDEDRPIIVESEGTPKGALPFDKTGSTGFGPGQATPTKKDSFGFEIDSGEAAHYMHRLSENGKYVEDDFEIDISEREDYDSVRELVGETLNAMNDYDSEGDSH